MSGKLVGEVLQYAPADLTVAERFVLVVLAEGARDKDRTTRYVTAEIVADRTGLKLGTIKNALMNLAHAGLIAPQHKAYRGRAQDYRITQLHAHHKATTTRPKASPPSDPIEAQPPLLRVISQ